MQESTPQPSAAVDPLAAAQQYQDHLIGKRLPDWVTRLSEPEFALLGNTLRQLLSSAQKLSATFASIHNLDDFARPLLLQALEPHGVLDADTLFLRRWYVYNANTVSYITGRVPMPDSDYYDVPLLEAALYNFTEQECRQQPRHNLVVDSHGVDQAGLSVLTFARLCRELDLGEQYQQHLNSVLDAGTGQQDAKALLVQFLCSNMLADALQAKAQGVLSEAELQLVIGLCRDNRVGRLEGAPVHVRQLSVFGCPLQRIVVFDVIDEGWVYNTSKRVLVYVPGDPQGAWSVNDDLDDYIRRVLGMRLREDDYRRFFRRFVRRRDSHRVFSAISERLDIAAWATRSLDEQTSAYPLPLFGHLADAWIARIKDDAAVIAPPVAQLDRQLQAEHDKRLRAEGWMLLTVAGLFVPMLGAVVAAVIVYELLQEAFQAIEDWRDDERDAALEHWLNVGKGTLTVVATSATVTLVRRTWSEVDTLVTARLEDGSEKLWNGDLQPYRGEGPPEGVDMDEQGIHRHGEDRWIEMQGHWYRVTQAGADEPWRLLPYRGHAPQLRHNDAGAWRLSHEQPAEWTGAHMMLRRLGRPFSELDDPQVDQVMAIHDLDEDHLRALHVYGRRADAGIADTASRILLAERIQGLVRQLREGLAVTDSVLLQRVRRLSGAFGEEGQALAHVIWTQRRTLLQQVYEEAFPDTDASTILRGHFASLHRLAADQVWRAASEDDRVALLATRRVPLLMAQAARTQLMSIRMARVHEALVCDTPQNLDLARVVLRLLARLPGASKGPAWRLFDADAERPLLTTGGDGAPFDVVHRNGLFSQRVADGESLAVEGELFDTLALAYDSGQRHALGLGEPFASALRERLAVDAMGQRSSIVTWLGLGRTSGGFMAPLQFEDGRVGYPLSGGRFWSTLGGRAPRALQARLRDLFPAFSDAQVAHWLEGAHAQARLEVLEQQYDALRTHLDQWVRGAMLSFELMARREFRMRLINCWRWLVPEHGDDLLQPQRYMLLQIRSRLQYLPSIPQSVSFPHVSILALRAMRMETIPDDFLRAFPNLRSLEITHCRLRRLPLPATLSERLEVLDLSGNKIALDEGQALVLAGCRSLVYLNLSFNPLGRSFSLFGMPRLNSLHLRASQLDTFPFGVTDSPELHTLDLRDNALYEFPDGFHESGLWRAGRVNLHGNLFAATPDALSIWHWLEESRVPYRMRWLDVAPAERRDDLSVLWTQLEAEQGSANFFDTLAALTSSGNFKSAPLARNFAVRLLDMFEYMARDPVLKQELYDNAAVTDCQDNATIRFSDLELRVLVWRARRSELARHPEGALLHLGGQLWRMSVLDQFAAEHALRVGAGSESIEFALAYRIALRAKLDLPIQQDDMLYFGIPNLSPWDLHRATHAVTAAQSADNLAQYMARQPFWQDYLRANYAGRLKVPQAMHEELQRLIDMGNREQEIARLHITTQQREHELMLQLTREAMGRARTISLDAP